MSVLFLNLVYIVGSTVIPKLKLTLMSKYSQPQCIRHLIGGTGAAALTR